MSGSNQCWLVAALITMMVASTACQSDIPVVRTAPPTQAPAKTEAKQDVAKPDQKASAASSGPANQGSPGAPGANDKAASPSTALEKVKVVQIFSSGALGPYWVTLDEGIFKKYGLDVETVFINGPQPAVIALNTRQADGLLTAPSPPTLSGSADGLDIALVFTFSNALSYFLVARPEIKTAADLKGKKLAVNRIGDSDYYLARDAFTRLGVNPDDIQYLAVGNMPDRVAALVAGMVDATTLAPPTDLTAKKQGMVQIADMGTLGIPYIANSFHLRKSLIKEKPQVAENIVKALVEGTYLFRSNKEVGMRAIQKNMSLDDQDILEYTWKLVADRAEKVPYPSMEGLKEVINLTAIEDSNLEGLPPEKVVDTSIVKKVEASGFIDQVYKGQ